MSRKTQKIKLIFCPLINVESFFKVISSFWVCVVRHAHITQNNKFSISLQNLKKEVRKQLIFCIQISMKAYYKLILWFWWRSSSIPKITSLQCLYNISKNKLEIKLTFCMQINIKVSYKLISSLWASNFSRRWYQGIYSRNLGQHSA